MQQCGECLDIYDESEFARCPFCDDGFFDRVPDWALDAQRENAALEADSAD